MTQSKLKRRSFLKLLAASSAAAAFPSIVRAQTLGLNGKVPPSNRITIGFIGVGSQGGGNLRANVNNDQFQVLAVCDADRSHLENAKSKVNEAYAARQASGGYKDCFATTEFREVLARPDIDAVWLSLPDHWHAIPLILAARAGKDIYAEKPLSLTIPEGRAMVQAVERSGVVCQIGSQQRSSIEFQKTVEAVRNGLLGKITRVRVGLPGGAGANLQSPMAAQTVPPELDYERWLGPAPFAPYYKERCHYQFRWIFDYSGGQLTDWIGHHFDIASWAMDLTHTGPVAIKNAKARLADGPLYNTATEYSFEAHYANGTVIEVGSIHPGGVTIEGSNGSVKVNRGFLEFNPPELKATPISSDGFHATRSSHAQNFIDCVRSRRTPRCPVHEAHRTATVAHLANIAFRTGHSELHWDPEKEEILNAPDAAQMMTRAYRSPWQLPV